MSFNFAMGLDVFRRLGVVGFLGMSTPPLAVRAFRTGSEHRPHDGRQPWSMLASICAAGAGAAAGGGVEGPRRAQARSTAVQEVTMKLSVDSLTKGLEFHGEVQGKRQRYYVLSSPRQYFVMSVSLAKRDAGNFNMVSKTAVEALYRRLRGRRVWLAGLCRDQWPRRTHAYNASASECSVDHAAERARHHRIDRVFRHA